MVRDIIKKTGEKYKFIAALGYNSRSSYMYKRIKFIAPNYL